MKSTPGPWKYGSTLTDGLAVMANEGLICVPILAIASENRANAALVSAAPELLEALEAALPLLRAYADGGWLSATLKAERATAKAKGEVK
jgi:hypothetical protein